MSAVAPEDEPLAAFFTETIDATANRVLTDLVARVLADDAAKDQLIADLVAAVSWYQAWLDKRPLDQAAVGRGLRYAREHRA